MNIGAIGEFLYGLESFLDVANSISGIFVSAATKAKINSLKNKVSQGNTIAQKELDSIMNEVNNLKEAASKVDPRIRIKLNSEADRLTKRYNTISQAVAKTADTASKIETSLNNDSVNPIGALGKGVVNIFRGKSFFDEGSSISNITSGIEQALNGGTNNDNQ